MRGSAPLTTLKGGGQDRHVERGSPWTVVTVLQAHLLSQCELIQLSKPTVSSKEQEDLFMILNIPVFLPGNITFMASK